MPSESTEIVFATPILTPLAGEPTHASLQLLQRVLNANALQIQHSRQEADFMAISPRLFQPKCNTPL